MHKNLNTYVFNFLFKFKNCLFFTGVSRLMDLLSDSREIIRNEVVQNKCTPLHNKLYGTFLSPSNIILFLFPLVVAGEA